jgi:poly(A) polymerase
MEVEAKDIRKRKQAQKAQLKMKNASEQNEEAAKFPTSEDIYKRILWDDDFEANDFEIGYEDRFRGLMYMPLRNFRGTGDATSEVPFHRVQIIRFHTGAIVWDRTKRICVLEDIIGLAHAGNNAGPLPQAAALARPAAPHATFRHTPLHVGPCAGEKPVHPAVDVATTMKCLSFNMLFSHADVNVFHPVARMKLFLQELEKEAADVVALQEVTPDAFQIMTAEFIKKNYYLSDTVGHSVHPTGQVILSRWPFHSAWQQNFGPVKRCVYGRIESPIGDLIVAAVHLTSDYANNSEERRVRELEQIIAEIGKGQQCLIIGDFNFGDEGPEQAKVNWSGVNDCWHTADTNDDKDGFTFDITTNWLAERTCRHHRYPRRLDRILFRTERLTPTTAAVCMKALEPRRVGDTEMVEIFASDHYGVACTFAVAEVRDVAAVDEATSSSYQDWTIIPKNLPLFHKSTVCIVAPQETWDVINQVRRLYDPVYFRWPNHINLLYPFARVAEFESLAGCLQAAAAKIEPFTVALPQLATFGGRSKYIYAEPAEEGKLAMCALHKSLIEHLPMCKAGRDFCPHLTVAQFNHQNAHQRAMGKDRFTVHLNNTFWRPVEFKVTHIHMMSRDGDDDPFRIIHSVPLGTVHCPPFPQPSADAPPWPPAGEDPGDALLD